MTWVAGVVPERSPVAVQVHILGFGADKLAVAAAQSLAEAVADNLEAGTWAAGAGRNLAADRRVVAEQILAVGRMREPP